MKIAYFGRHRPDVVDCRRHLIEYHGLDTSYAESAEVEKLREEHAKLHADDPLRSGHRHA